MTGVARALVVGVAETTFGNGKLPPLPGARSDAISVGKVLSQRGFTVAVHTERPEVRQACVGRAIASLVTETHEGDLSVIYLAGHGYRIRNTTGTERDGWDEAFVCGDGAILDDWFRDELWPAANPGARFVVVVDACHSESITLGLRADDIPPVPPPVLVVSTYYRLTLAACRDEEIALSAAREDGGDGVVTSALVDRLLLGGDATYEAIWQAVATSVRDRYAHKRVGTPQLDSYGPDFKLQHSAAFRWPLP